MSIFKACSREFKESLRLRQEQELAEKKAVEEKKRAVTEKFAPAIDAIDAFFKEEKIGIEQEGFQASIELGDTSANLYFVIGEGAQKSSFRFMAAIETDFTANVHGWINTVGQNYETIFQQPISLFGDANFQKSLEDSFREFMKIAFEKAR